MRNEFELYPDYLAEIAALDAGGVTAAGADLNILYRIIRRHRGNAAYNKRLLDRYKTTEGGVPISRRKPRFEDDAAAVNNKINNDFFSEIVDFKVGYFAGNPIGYSYAHTEEAKETTGGDAAWEAASKCLTDFIVRTNMYDVDMEVTKYAAICGYAGRLFYIDTDGCERAMAVEPQKVIVLSDTEVTEPRYAVRYFKTVDINDKTVWKVEFYDDTYIYYYEGSLGHLTFIRRAAHMFDRCPLQAIPNNREMLGDAEKVLELIDAYDRELSDCDNEIESFARAYMVYENMTITDEEIARSQKTGVIAAYTGDTGKVYFLTKDINDTFTSGMLDRIEQNIYRFSKTPNLNDETFTSASGISLKFKLTGLETKCGMFQAKMQAAGNFMFKLLASAWGKKRVQFEPLQCVMDFKRNFPLDTLSEAQAAVQMINAGLPKRVAYQLAFSAIDDIDYVMQMIEEEETGEPDMDRDIQEVGNDSQE